ncbi:hypothetical protein MKW94_021978, partial [Papaver nudicaule]|nr:hypothetical protein [Papaver nudicaule]
MKRVIVNMKGYLEEVWHITKLNPQDVWLPITKSRNGNARYAAFNNLNAGIGFQALLLLVAFSYLGCWGIIVAYFWQHYTLWVLVQLHEAVLGKRYNRYVELAQAGERLGGWLALFPTIYLFAGTGTLIFQIVCGPPCSSNPLTTVEWYLVFTSLIGAITAIVYCTIVWVLSVTQMRPPSISYQPISSPTINASTFSIFNALGVIAFAFRGYNLDFEIQLLELHFGIFQATMPSIFKHPAHVPMWRGAKVSYTLIAMCVFVRALL